MPECGAQLRGQPGIFCKQNAMTNGKCRLHGGKTPAPGIGHPNYTHGKYSNSLPARMVEDYELSRKDPQLIELSEEISLVEARAKDLVRRVDSGESGHLWKQLRAAMSALQGAMRAGDPAEINETFRLANSLVARGQLDYAAWADIGKQIDRKRSLVDTERRRRSELQESMTPEQAYMFVGAVLGSVVRHVSDRDIRAAIQTDIARIAGPRRQSEPDDLS